MRKTMFILIALLILFSIGMIILYGASGHRINIYNYETQKYLLSVSLYTLTSSMLLIFVYKQKSLIKNISIGLLFLTVLSFVYLFYEMVKVKIGDFFALLPISMILIILYLSIKVIVCLIKNEKK
jgi:hypothetical protein